MKWPRQVVVLALIAVIYAQTNANAELDQERATLLPAFQQLKFLEATDISNLLYNIYLHELNTNRAFKEKITSSPSASMVPGCRSHVKFYRLSIREQKMVLSYAVRLFDLSNEDQKERALNTMNAEKVVKKLKESAHLETFLFLESIAKLLWKEADKYDRKSVNNVIRGTDQSAYRVYLVLYRPLSDFDTITDQLSQYHTLSRTVESMEQNIHRYALALGEMHIKTVNVAAESDPHKLNSILMEKVKTYWNVNRVRNVLKKIQRTQAVVLDEEKFLKRYVELRDKSGMQRRASFIHGKPDCGNVRIHGDNRVVFLGIDHVAKYAVSFEDGSYSFYGPPELDYHVALRSIQLVSISFSLPKDDIVRFENLFSSTYCGAYHLNREINTDIDVSHQKCQFPSKPYEEYIKFLATIVILDEDVDAFPYMEEWKPFALHDWINADDENIDYEEIVLHRI